MSTPSEQTLRRLAGEIGLQLAALGKTLRHLDLLRAISRDPVLSDRFALKGGTALNHFCLAPERLSFDIDLRNQIGWLSQLS